MASNIRQAEQLALGRTAGQSEPVALAALHELQVDQAASAMPLLLMFHGSAALSIYRLNDQCSVSFVCGIWHWLAVGIGFLFAGFVLLWWHLQKTGQTRNNAEFALRYLELCSLGLALVWAMPAAAYVASQVGYPILPVIGISLAVMGVVVVSLLRVPIGAIVFTSLITTTLAYSVFLALEQFKFIAAFVCVIYGLVLVGLILKSYLDFRRHTIAELTLKQQQQVITLLLNDFENGTSDWLWETDQNGQLKYFSPRLSEILQRETNDLMTASLRGALASHLQPVSWHDLESSLRKEVAFVALPLQLNIQGKAACWEISAKPLQDQDGHFSGFRGVGRDVTEKIMAERNLLDAIAASEKASTAKSQFLSIISHELRTPINAIVGFSELLTKDNPQPLTAAQQQEFCTTILENAQSLQLMINDLLDATRLESGTLNLTEQVDDAAELVEGAIRLNRDDAEKAEVTILGKLNENISLRADLRRVRQIVVNLLANAIKFSPIGGIVHVEMLHGSHDEFILQISDAGVGIPAEEIERVFDAFTQAETGATRRFGGVGLGLSIARRLARLHGGDITLQSATGAGTTARLIFPAERVIWPATITKTKTKQVA